MLRAKRVAKIGQRICKREQFNVVINWFRGKKFELERFAVAVPKFLESFVVRPRAFVGGAHEQARVFEEGAVERARLPIETKLLTLLLKITINERVLGDLVLRFRNSIVGAGCRF